MGHSHTLLALSPLLSLSFLSFRSQRDSQDGAYLNVLAHRYHPYGSRVNKHEILLLSIFIFIWLHFPLLCPPHHLAMLRFFFPSIVSSFWDAKPQHQPQPDILSVRKQRFLSIRWRREWYFCLILSGELCRAPYKAQDFVSLRSVLGTAVLHSGTWCLVTLQPKEFSCNLNKQICYFFIAYLVFITLKILPSWLLQQFSPGLANIYIFVVVALYSPHRLPTMTHCLANKRKWIKVYIEIIQLIQCDDMSIFKSSQLYLYKHNATQ